VLDLYHGTQVADPYRWLEDDQSAETAAWVAAQNKVSKAFLNKIPARDAIRSRLQTLWNYERFGIPVEYGGLYFLSRNSGLQNHSVLYVSDSLTAEPRVLLDPNTLSEDGSVSLSGWSPSEDGKLLAYSLSKSGSDWLEIKVKDVATGKDLPDHLEWVKFSSPSWAKDHGGFYYERYPEPPPGTALTQQNKKKQVYFHKIGDRQDMDQLIYARPDEPDWGFNSFVTDDGRYLIIYINLGTDPRNRVYYKDLQDAQGKVIPLLDDFDADYRYIGNIGTTFYFQTDLHAPRHRVISLNLAQPDKAHWQEIIPQSDEKLDGVSLMSGLFFTTYLKDARSVLRAYDLDGKKQRDIELPGIGTVYGFGGRQDDVETFYMFTSFTTPAVIYRYDIASGKSTVFREPTLDFDGSKFETRQVFVTSKDGTKVPLFITHRKGLKLDGSNPCLLYGYGGFNISLTPAYQTRSAVWLEMGGVFVTANLRGGGEYGEEWHLAGTKLSKQNVFDDFIASAEWLIQNGYTRNEKLAIQGGSNGGLLVGACMTQRPELFGAALPAVGVMDMLRYHKFTIGWAWTSDYGSSDNPEEFKALYAYSPLHRLKEGVRYPATLITTGDHDDRVVPAHSFKFAARLQACQAKDGPPVLIRIETKAGHGAGTALNKVMEQTADQWAFLVRVLDIKADEGFLKN